jgi:hypothetical protein
MKTTLLIISIFTVLGFTLIARADEQETDSSPETVNSVTDSSLGIRTDFVTTKDGNSYVCTTVPGSAGFSQTFCN